MARLPAFFADAQGKKTTHKLVYDYDMCCCQQVRQLFTRHGDVMKIRRHRDILRDDCTFQFYNASNSQIT